MRTTNEGPVEHAAGRGMLQGAAAGFVIVASVTVGIMLNAGAGLVPSLGVAAFAGFWGGPGFGGMLGATVASIHAEEATPSIRSVPKPTESSRIDHDPAHRTAA